MGNCKNCGAPMISLFMPGSFACSAECDIEKKIPKDGYKLTGISTLYGSEPHEIKDDFWVNVGLPKPKFTVSGRIVPGNLNPNRNWNLTPRDYRDSQYGDWEGCVIKPRNPCAALYGGKKLVDSKQAGRELTDREMVVSIDPDYFEHPIGSGLWAMEAMDLGYAVTRLVKNVPTLGRVYFRKLQLIPGQLQIMTWTDWQNVESFQVVSAQSCLDDQDGWSIHLGPIQHR